MTRAVVLAAALLVAGCGGGAAGGGADGGGGSSGGGSSGGGSSGGGSSGGNPALCAGVTCSGHGTCAATGSGPVCRCDPGWARASDTTCVASASPTIAGCPILPADHLFNTPIDDLPVHASDATWRGTIGAKNIHLDMGTQTSTTAGDYWGIPYNVVSGSSLTWTKVAYTSPDPDMSWDPRPESDCPVASGGGHSVNSPCNAAAPVFPIPASPKVEGGTSTASDHQPYGDHHLLLLDADTCWLWELYHVYHPSRGWEIFGSAGFDLRSDALRPDGWTSADAAGFPILPLLLRADEASSGTIRHALRFTLQSTRDAHVWPARHEAGSSASSPPMGQLFRLRADYPIPASYHAQSRAILQAMKTYGMYLADNGSNLYVQGEPSASWAGAVFSEVQRVTAADLQAVDTSVIERRAGFDRGSGRVPPP